MDFVVAQKSVVVWGVMDGKMSYIYSSHFYIFHFVMWHGNQFENFKAFVVGCGVATMHLVWFQMFQVFIIIILKQK